MDKMVYTRSEVDMDMPICKYMDLDYFICMMEKCKFYIRIKKEFEDKRESRLPLKRLFMPFEAHKTPTQDELEECAKKEKERVLTYQEISKWPTSCWTMKTYENYLMWKAYTSNCGVCIKTTVRKFINAVDYSHFDLICAKVLYDGFDFVGKNDIVSKDRYYEDERELRFYFEPLEALSENTNFIELPIAPAEMIDSVILSPRIHPVCARKIADFLSEKYTIKTSLSQIELSR